MQKRPCEEALILARVRSRTVYARAKYIYPIGRGGGYFTRAKLELLLRRMETWMRHSVAATKRRSGLVSVARV
jgi:hypothetical protein